MFFDDNYDGIYLRAYSSFDDYWVDNKKFELIPFDDIFEENCDILSLWRFCARNGKIQHIGKLLKDGIPEEAFTEALETGKLDFVRELLKHVDGKNYTSYVVYSAAYYHHFEILQELLDAGFSVGVDTVRRCDSKCQKILLKHTGYGRYQMLPCELFYLTGIESFPKWALLEINKLMKKNRVVHLEKEYHLDNNGKTCIGYYYGIDSFGGSFWTNYVDAWDKYDIARGQKEMRRMISKFNKIASKVRANKILK